MSGFRISECLSLTVSSVFRNDHLTAKIGVAPRNLKGGYGQTRWVPVLPELARAPGKLFGLAAAPVKSPAGYAVVSEP
jgi:integrase